MANWFNRFRTRSPQRDLATDRERLGVLDGAFAQTIESAMRERDGLQRRLSEIGTDASFLETEPEAGNDAKLTEAENQMRATSARLAGLKEQIDQLERLRGELASISMAHGSAEPV